MISIAIILLLVADVALFVGMIFVKSKGARALFYVLSIFALICLGLVCGLYSNSFAGELIFLIISPLPLVLSAIDFSSNQKSEKPRSFSVNSVENSESFLDTKKTRTANHSLNLTLLVHGLGALICSVCLFFASMYIGVESIFGAVAGVALGFAFAFLRQGLKKQTSWQEFVSVIFFAVGAGMTLCAGLCAILYAFSLSNIIFTLGAVLLAVHFICKIFVEKDDSLAFRIEDSATFILGFAMIILSTIV